MFLRELTASVDHLKGAGAETIKALAQAGIITLADLLCHYPRDWEDRSRQVLLRDFARYPVCTLVRVLAHEWFGFGRMKTLKIHVEDESGQAVLVCFNRPFLEKQLIVGEQYRLWGRFYYKYGELQSTAFEAEPRGEDGDDASPTEGAKGFGHILPVYPLSGKLTQGLFRRLIRRALGQYAKPLEDELPPAIIQRDELLPKGEALRAIHFPGSLKELEQARRTLIYEELFYLEVMVGRRALERKASFSGTKGNMNAEPSSAYSPLQARLLERLPFALTPGQAQAMAEINRDMDGPYPMARLLQGDVGSGKTLVSFLAALRAVERDGSTQQSGQTPPLGQVASPLGQAAIMAPTELLARQHAENAARLLEPLGIRPAFLTGNIKAAGRTQLLKALAAGAIDIVVGTHALFSRDVVYRNLRLVVVDEQHRFGVTQRQAIMDKGDHPDLLMMSATPIPRTLALTVFGDLDVSVIPDMPPGRKPIKTHLAKESNEAKVYDFVRKELAAGHQAYFVYPLIGDLDDRNPKGTHALKDVLSMAERLAKTVFPQYPMALVHSKLEEEEKLLAMEAFRRGEIRVLAATSVVEVGVDVPNATCMVIEHAERFGLSALHQLRGRVGRGEAQSYCFLIYSDSSDIRSDDPRFEDPRSEDPGSAEPREGSALTESGKTRLKVMMENNDGFVIAEEDLKLRGPGQIVGIEQSGYLSLGIANPVRDAEELARARTDAFAILEEDPGFLLPEYRRIAQVLERAPPFSKVTL